jgi:hypothetical protein
MKLKLVFISLFYISLFGASPKCLYLESPGYIGGAGMFHNFNIVLGCLELYDKNPHLSFQIDFKDQGLYYNPAHGPNWWSYYFETTFYAAKQRLSKRSAIKVLKDNEKAELGNTLHFFSSKEQAASLIKKYIQVKQDILQEVDHFAQKHFSSTQVLGVHYRGSDKWLEAEYVSYQRAIDTIKHYFTNDMILFVATDELGFLEAMQETFGSKVIFTSSQRRGDHQALHYFTDNGYLQGKEALIDCLLLSKCHTLIRTNSNLSAVSAFFNPHLNIVNLNTLNPDLYKSLCQKGKLNELNLFTLSH